MKASRFSKANFLGSRKWSKALQKDGSIGINLTSVCSRLPQKVRAKENVVKRSSDEHPDEGYEVSEGQQRLQIKKRGDAIQTQLQEQ